MVPVPEIVELLILKEQKRRKKVVPWGCNVRKELKERQAKKKAEKERNPSEKRG